MRATDAGEPDVLWRALAVARVVLLGYAVVVSAVHAEDHERAGAVWAILAVLGLWTAAAPVLYQREAGRRPALIVAEFSLASGALLLTPWAQGDQPSDVPSVPSFWIAAPVVAAAIQWEWRGGLIGALILVPVDVAVRAEVTGTTAANIFLLIVVGLIVGYAASLVRISTRERAAAAAARAAVVERDRLARSVHDGVLQALAYLQRRCGEIGGEAELLAQLAGEQEVALRTLVRGGTGGGADSGSNDLAALLQREASSTVSVATPGAPVPLPAPVAAELVAAVRAALDNTVRHAGGAAAYVLLEDEGEQVVISVGDAGPGIPPGRLEQAAEAGRLGVTHSIRTRLVELGGTATLTSAPGAGTEWEFRLPRPAGSRLGDRLLDRLGDRLGDRQ